jgi:hypothetical protein
MTCFTTTRFANVKIFFAHAPPSQGGLWSGIVFPVATRHKATMIQLITYVLVIVIII